MSEPTRHLDRDELARALAPFAEQDPVAARPIHVARDATPRRADPATKLGIGAPRTFRAPLPPVDARPAPARPSQARAAQARVSEARASHPQLPPAPRARPSVASRVRIPGLRKPHAWLVALALGGFALGGLIALTTHTTRATARVPAGVRSPPALPAPLDVAARSPAREQDQATGEPAPTVTAIEPAPRGVGRRSAVDALLAGRNRIALEHYDRVLAEPAPLAERDALRQIARVLRRELHRCEQEAGTPCGLCARSCSWWRARRSRRRARWW